MRENQQMHQLYSFSLLVMYGSFYIFRHYIAILMDVPPERCPNEEQSIEYCGWACCVYWRRVYAYAHHVTRNNTPIYNILSTALQFSISQKALGMLPEDGNVMPKHVGATIHN
jgi:hypothetical protein